MNIRFYKESTGNFGYWDKDGHYSGKCAGTCGWGFNGTLVYINGLNGFNGIEVTDIQKSETEGDNYTSIDDFKEATKDFFVKASSGSSGGGLTPDQEFQLEEAYDERHVHDNIAILGAMEAAFTSALESKLKSLTDAYKGLFDNEVAIQNAYPLPSAGFNAWNVETETMWGVSNGIWIDTKSASFGDMLISTYDKTGVKADVFDFANMFGSFAKDLLPKYTTIDLGSLVKPFKNMHASGLVYAGGGVVLTDETTNLTYKLKVKDGSLYLEEL